MSNYVFAQAGFTLRGALCTLGIFAAFSSQYRRDKKLLGPPFKRGTDPLTLNHLVNPLVFIVLRS